VIPVADSDGDAVQVRVTDGTVGLTEETTRSDGGSTLTVTDADDCGETDVPE
jgi:hypothetical protein